MVDEAGLREKRLVQGQWDGIKILGNGELKKKLTVKAHKFSEKAKSLIEGAGGSVEVLPMVVHKPESAAKAHSGKGVKAPRVIKA